MFVEQVSSLIDDAGLEEFASVDLPCPFDLIKAPPVWLV
jgi:hypothetical protein